LNKKAQVTILKQTKKNGERNITKKKDRERERETIKIDNGVIEQLNNVTIIMGEVKNQQKGNLKIGLKNKRIKEQIDVIIYLIHR
jgi:hypothetical protein